MDAVARRPAADREALFREAAARLGVSPNVVEKDFWVCWSLKRLYTIESLPRLLLKGGTSLSKCFGIIQRFSEDIDIGIERVDLGIACEDLPSADMGSTRLKRARARLRDRTLEYIEGVFLQRLRAGFAQALQRECTLLLSEGGSEPTLFFEYPRTLGRSAYRAERYIAPTIRLELGSRSDHDPVENVQIVPIAAGLFPQVFADPACKVVAQAPQRTLLEKALILHTDRAKGRVSPRSSRHAYDLAMLYRFGAVERVSADLFEQVATHKRVFGDDAPAGRALDTGLCMVPTAALSGELERDYREMQEMFFEDVPTFTELIADLRELEAAINARR